MAADQVRFALRGISVEQFAMIFEPDDLDKVSFNISLTIKSNYADRAIAFNLTINYTEEDRTFLQLENTCHFLINEEDWERLSAGNTEDVKLQKRAVANLFSIAIGTTRGILHAKTENTAYNRFYLPLLNATEMINESVTIKRQTIND